MEPRPADRQGTDPSIVALNQAPTPAPRRPAARLWPLAALAFTTISLAASAVRVVDSSLSEATAPPIAPAVSVAPADPPEDFALLDLDDPPALPAKRPDSASRPLSRPIPKVAKPPAEIPPPAPPKPAPPKFGAKRVLVKDKAGRPIVAEVHGQDADRTAVLLPDGQIGWPDGLVFTDRPFVPESMDALRARLLGGEFLGFDAVETKHYLVLYQEAKGSKAFAQTAAGVLENLYAGLIAAFNKREIPVHDAEFPLVAVIFKTEEEFRKRKRVDPDVQAYYEILSNRIFMYAKSSRDETSPEVAALRKPQTVAHEGTHQILQNIGLQSRLADWPLWLVEGLAEYCASPKIAKNGAANWGGLGQVNLLHLATLRDLDDPLAAQVRGAAPADVVRERGKSTLESLLVRTDLSPTDYALSWAVTYYLAYKRTDDFLDYLREMSALKPLEKRTPDDHLRTFKAAFGDKLEKLDQAVLTNLRKLKQIDALPHYAVMFEQPMPGNVVRRAAMVSQSPSMIRQWIENSTSPRGGDPRWQILPYPTKARALLMIEQWVGGG